MSNISKIIGLCGEKGCGKDTIANYLVEKHKYTKVSFAHSVKKVVSELFGWPYELLLGETEESRIWRETVDGWWTRKLNMGRDITPRFILQHIGTDVMRNHFHPDIWLLTVEKKMHDIMKETGNTHFVVSDLRFINEYRWIRSFENNKIIAVHRGELPKYFNDVKNGKITEVPGVHISEILWMAFDTDVRVYNDSTIDELYKFAKKYNLRVIEDAAHAFGTIYKKK